MSKKVNEIIKAVKPILVKYGIKKAELFGASVRGDYRPDSDVDILIEFPPEAGLFFVGKLYGDLKDTLGKEVDLVSYKAVHPYIRKYVFEHTYPII